MGIVIELGVPYFARFGNGNRFCLVYAENADSSGTLSVRRWSRAMQHWRGPRRVVGGLVRKAAERDVVYCEAPSLTHPSWNVLREHVIAYNKGVSSVVVPWEWRDTV